MSRIINSSLIASAVIFSFVSCSVFRPNAKRNIKTAEEVVDTLKTLDVNPTDTLDNIYIFSEDYNGADTLDALRDSIDPMNIEAMPVAEEEEEEQEGWHFEGAQTASMIIPEYRNVEIDDMVIDLSAEDSCYPADGHVTSNYGWRWGRMHTGTDIKVQVGDSLHAAFDGVVRMAKYYGAYGNCVIIRHYNGLETLYGHASKLCVEVNDEVKAGDLIALGGSTGRSTGSHLHFETRIAGHYFSPLYVINTKDRVIKDGKLYITMRRGRLFVSNNDSKEEREAQILEQISIRYHTVRRGDTLGGIASRNGTTVSTLCRLNGIRSTSVLRIGQRLIVRDGVRVAKTANSGASNSAKSSSSATSTPKASYSGATTTYRVKSGDTLGQIAERNNTRVSTICSLNNISSRSTLRVGQSLKLPSSGGSSASTSSHVAASGSTHTVKSGDTLGAIAGKYGTTVSALCSLNNITSRSTLRIGQRLQIPSSAKRSGSTSSSAASSSSSYHIVKSGDTLSEIAETYGTSVSALCRLNGISAKSMLNLKQKIRFR